MSNNRANSCKTLPEPAAPRACPGFDLPGQRDQAAGQIESFDQYAALLRNTVTQMVYKHAISTIVPGRPVQFNANLWPPTQPNRPLSDSKTLRASELRASCSSAST